jgi:hypothetical protein
MRVVTSGLSNLQLSDCISLVEPIPFELSENCRKNLVIAENFENFKPLLQDLHNLSRNGDHPSARRLIEALIATPCFLRSNKQTRIDLEVVDVSSVTESLVGENFRDFHRKCTPPVLPGMTRDEVFQSRVAPLLPATLQFVVLDRFLAAQMVDADYLRSGAYWFLKKIFDDGPALIRIISARRVGREDVDAELFRNRILSLMEEVGSSSTVELVLGFTSHDRQMNFYFGKNRGNQSVTLGAGADIFKHHNLRDGYAIVNLDPETAAANENSATNSRAIIKYILKPTSPTS